MAFTRLSSGDAFVAAIQKLLQGARSGPTTADDSGYVDPNAERPLYSGGGGKGGGPPPASTQSVTSGGGSGDHSDFYNNIIGANDPNGPHYDWNQNQSGGRKVPPGYGSWDQTKTPGYPDLPPGWQPPDKPPGKGNARGWGPPPPGYPTAPDWIKQQNPDARFWGWGGPHEPDIFYGPDKRDAHYPGPGEEGYNPPPGQPGHNPGGWGFQSTQEKYGGHQFDENQDPAGGQLSYDPNAKYVPPANLNPNSPIAKYIAKHGSLPDWVTNEVALNESEGEWYNRLAHGGRLDNPDEDAWNAAKPGDGSDYGTWKIHNPNWTYQDYRNYMHDVIAYGRSTPDNPLYGVRVPGGGPGGGGGFGLQPPPPGWTMQGGTGGGGARTSNPGFAASAAKPPGGGGGGSSATPPPSTMSQDPTGPPPPPPEWHYGATPTTDAQKRLTDSLNNDLSAKKSMMDMINANRIAQGMSPIASALGTGQGPSTWTPVKY